MNAAAFKETAPAAEALGMRLEALAARTPEELPSALATAKRKRVEALIVAPDSMLVLHRQAIVDFAATNRLPAMYNFREDSESGGLMSYGADLYENFRSGSVFVDISKYVGPVNSSG
jgi:putative ABC transport system substrate-binding protein